MTWSSPSAGRSDKEIRGGMEEEFPEPGSGHRGTHGRQLVEAGEELIEQLHELLGAAGRRQLGEAHDVREEDAAGRGAPVVRLSWRHRQLLLPAHGSQGHGGEQVLAQAPKQ